MIERSMEKVLLAAMGSDESNDAREYTFCFHRTRGRFKRHGSSKVVSDQQWQPRDATVRWFESVQRSP